jgi:hypothetical protein
MSYILNKTNGDLVVELTDGTIDDTTTDITLVGRNYRGFGEFFNENFIKITENFANSLPPDAPLIGQLWYDTNTEKLKFYNGTTFRSAGGALVSDVRPNLVEGDFWIDTLNRQLYFYDGNQDNELTLVGPQFNTSQGKTGLEVISVIDTSSVTRVVILIQISDNLFGVITDENFKLSGRNKIQGYPDDPDDTFFPPRQNLQKGINLVNNELFFRGSATQTEFLIDSEGNLRRVNDFMSSIEDTSTSGSVFIKNSNGLLIGKDDILYSQLKISGTTTVLQNERPQTDIAIRTKLANTPIDALYIDADKSRMGIFKSAPEYTLDVDGDINSSGNLTISGDLIVNGETTFINTSEISLEDKTLELAASNGNAITGDNFLDDAGIVIKSTDGDKTFQFSQSQNAWNTNININLASGREYQINNRPVLTETELGNTVTSSSLTSLGQLISLTVDDITIDGTRISTIGTGSDLDLVADGDINANSSRLVNVLDPSNPQDVATKSYVDSRISPAPISLALDISALSDPTISNPYNSVATILTEIAPPAGRPNGTIARIHCTSYSASNISGIEVQDAMDKSFIDVDSNGTQNESVVQDINFSTAGGVISITPTRSLMTFELLSGEWSWIDTV